MPGSVLSPPDLRSAFAGLLQPKLRGMQRALNIACDTLGKPLPVAKTPPLAVPETTLYEFVTQRPFLIDRQPFDWANHRYQIPLYNAFRLDPAENEGLELVWIKGAQIGASTFSMLALLFTAVKFPGTWTGYYLPDREMADIFSGNRFKPLVQSNRHIASILGDTGDGEGEDRKRIRNIGQSTVVFGYMGGVTSTESVPMLGIFLDELRRMQLTDVSLVQQRISHSPYPIDVKLSTAGYPGQDIAAAFARTNQHYWHTRCACSDGVILSEIWPACIGVEGEDIFYRCPACSTRIADPQDGQYIAHAPGKTIHGYHTPQTLSHAKLHSPAHLWADYTNPNKDRGEFVRSVLGRPFVDPENQLVTEEDLQACLNPDVHWEQEGVNCAIGIDCMGGWNDVVVLRRGDNGKARLIHLERIEGDDPFGDGRLDSIMRRFEVSCACCDLNPSYNESMRFSRRWLPRAFLVTYSSSERADMIAWRDRLRKKDQQANEDEVKWKWVVCIQRYKALDYALGLFKKRLVELPHPRGLIQTVKDDTGVTRPVFMGEELFMPHMKRIVRQKHMIDEEQLTYKMEMIKIGADPHFAFAFTYAVCGLSRIPGGKVAIL